MCSPAPWWWLQLCNVCSWGVAVSEGNIRPKSCAVIQVPVLESITQLSHHIFSNACKKADLSHFVAAKKTYPDICRVLVLKSYLTSAAKEKLSLLQRSYSRISFLFLKVFFLVSVFAAIFIQSLLVFSRRSTQSEVFFVCLQ